jgi:hypothetical protein
MCHLGPEEGALFGRNRLSDYSQHTQQPSRFKGPTKTGHCVDFIRVVHHVDAISGKENDGSDRPRAPTEFGELVATESWHVTIHYNDGIEHPIEHAFQRFIPVPRKMDLILCLFEQAGQQVPIAHVIFRNKNFFPATLHRLLLCVR